MSTNAHLLSDIWKDSNEIFVFFAECDNCSNKMSSDHDFLCVKMDGAACKYKYIEDKRTRIDVGIAWSDIFFEKFIFIISHFKCRFCNIVE